MKICTVEGCNGKHYSKGLCQKHYKQMKRGTLVQVNIGQDSTDNTLVQHSTDIGQIDIVQVSTEDIGQEVVLSSIGQKEETEVTKPKPPKLPRPVKKPAKKLSDEELYKKLVIESFDYLSEDESLSLEEHYYKYHNTSYLFLNGIDKDEFITWQMKTYDGALRDREPFPKPKSEQNVQKYY